MLCVLGIDNLGAAWSEALQRKQYLDNLTSFNATYPSLKIQNFLKRMLHLSLSAKQ